MNNIQNYIDELNAVSEHTEKQLRLIKETRYAFINLKHVTCETQRSFLREKIEAKKAAYKELTGTNLIN